MKLALILAAAGVAAMSMSSAYADPPARNHVCIQTSMIQSMSYPDDKTIIFHMFGGPVKAWRNDLQNVCHGLKFEQGIAWTIWGNEVCSNMQVFYVLRRGTPCMLGNFTPVNPAPAAH